MRRSLSIWFDTNAYFNYNRGKLIESYIKYKEKEAQMK